MYAQTRPLLGALPVEFSSLVGRRADLVSARAALGTTRLLTLLGPGGVGKTRLAIRLAQSVAKHYPDGTWFVDLSSVRVGGVIADEVARVFELATDHADEFLAIAHFFAQKRGLLVIDNCEQVVDECARLVRRILKDCPGMSVIATSRVALRLTAETVFVVDPLETDESRKGTASAAVTLFLERSAEYLPDPDPTELEIIAEICRRLDGLPLAIELAATRVKVLTPAQLRERLVEPLSVLSSGARDAPDRQQTMRAAIQWSYELCTDVERALWRRMSVFAGGWDLDSAEWMMAEQSPEIDALEAVQSLLEKSILTRRQLGDMVVFDMLETVRSFGLESTSAHELEQARARHRDWYLVRLAELEADWYGPNQARWLALTRRELPNIREALEFTISQGDAARAATLLTTAHRIVWQAQGRVEELHRWGLRVAALEAPVTPDTCQVLSIVGAIEVLVQHNDEAGYQHLAQAEADAEKVDDQFTKAFLHFMRCTDVREPEKALARYERANALQGGSNLVPARADIEESVTLAHDRVGQVEIATAMRERLVQRAIECGDCFETSLLLLASGSVAASRGEFDTATAMMRQGLILSQNLESPSAVARAMEALAKVAMDSQDFGRAALLLGMSHPSGDPAGAIAATYPASATFRIDLEKAVRSMLGPRAYDTAYAKARAWSEDEGIAFALGAELPPRHDTLTDDTTLSARERQVAALVGQGLSNKEIAARLVISPRTAEGHVAKILMKLGFTSRTQLAAWASTEGL